MTIASRLILISLLVVTFFSCSKSKVAETQPEPSTPVKVKLLSRVTISRKLAPNEVGQGNTVNGYEITVADHTYNDKKQLIAVRSNTNEVTYQYDDAGNVVRVTDANIIAGGATDMVFVYEEGRVITVTSKTPGPVGIRTVIYGYSYMGDNIATVSQTEGGLMTGVYTYAYPGALAIKQTAAVATLPSMMDVTYDGKKTPYHNISAKNAMGFPIGPFGRSNILTQSTNFTTLTNTTKIINNTYTYDADDYPKTLVSLATHSQTTSVSEIRYTYEYIEK